MYYNACPIKAFLLHWALIAINIIEALIRRYVKIKKLFLQGIRFK